MDNAPSIRPFIRPLIYTPPTDPIDILYADEHTLIINKPAGLLSVPGKTPEMFDCLESRLQAIYPHARIIHRLDLATSGIMVLAMTHKALRHIGLQFERRHVKKSYKAVVWGEVQGGSGHINLPLICDWPNRPLQKVDFETGKSAQTDWHVTRRENGFTHLDLHPKTGRSHQLRVHLKEIGHPILGDPLYAHEDAYQASNRLMLHAHTLAFYHPDGGKWTEYETASPF
ncbi:MAG: RNA pseudouridine synthase [Robiginitomaculum sp.]|nr:RNA pseudouridine synthase [Robiginitomaculum sp.]